MRRTKGAMEKVLGAEEVFWRCMASLALAVDARLASSVATPTPGASPMPPLSLTDEEKDLLLVGWPSRSISGNGQSSSPPSRPSSRPAARPARSE